jgi:hypothetical protein
MNTYIPMVLTAIVTVSTIVYTFYSIQLWRTTRLAAEISRQAAFSNLWAELNRYLEILREEKAPETAFLEKFSNLLLEFMIGSLMTHAVAKDDPDFEEFRRRVSTLAAENQANISRVPWIERLIAQKNR